MTDDYGEIYRGKDGKWYARRKAPNHEIISASEAYERRQSAVEWVVRQELELREQPETVTGP